MDLRQYNVKRNNLEVSRHQITKKHKDNRPYSFAKEPDQSVQVSDVHLKIKENSNTFKVAEKDAGNKGAGKDQKKESPSGMKSNDYNRQNDEHRYLNAGAMNGRKKTSCVQRSGDYHQGRVVQNNVVYKSEDKEQSKTQNNTEFQEKDVQKEVLNESIKSDATYLSVMPDSEFPNFRPGLPERRDRNWRPKRQSYRRIIVISLILGILITIGLVLYFVVFRSKNGACPDPKVEHGSVTVKGDTALLDCEDGYFNPLQEPIRCENGLWNTAFLCRLANCGRPQNNTIFNGTFVFQNTTFNATAYLVCDNGYMASCLPEFVCKANGNWTPACDVSCVPHPCGKYIMPNYTIVEKDFSYENMTMKLKCKEEFTFISANDTFIRCENETRKWLGNADCEIPGNITFSPTDPVFNSTGTHRIVSCSVQNSPVWKYVTLQKLQFLNGSERIHVATISNISGLNMSVGKETYLPKVTFTESVNGVYIHMTFDLLNCTDNGIYICSIVVGDVKNPVALKSASTSVTVIVQTSTIPVLTAPRSARQGTNITCTCKGTLGLDEKDNKLGQMYLQIKYQNDSGFRNVTPTISDSYKKNCQIVEFIEATFTVANAMENATLRCITFTVFNEPPLNSRNHIITVNTTKVFFASVVVHISNLEQPWQIGRSASITGTIENILGWKLFEIKKVCNDSETRISRVYANKSLEQFFEHLTLNNVNTSEESAKFELIFNNIRCSDACFTVTPANFEIAIQLENELYQERLKVNFNVSAEKPLISYPCEFHLGQEVTISCEGNVGLPAASMMLRLNGKTISQTTPPTYNFNTDTCVNMQTTKYSFIVKDQNKGDEFDCVTILGNLTMLHSNKTTVIPRGSVLYFTEESTNGVIEQNKRLTCILTSTENLTSMAIFRGANISPLCSVNVTEEGSCSDGNYSISGHYEQNKTRFIMDIDTSAARCIDDTEYSCAAYGACIFKTKMKFNATKSMKKPVMLLPTTLVVDQPTFSWEILKCTADLGYPSEGLSLRMHVLYEGTQTYVNYALSGASVETGSCQKNATISLRSQIFNSSFNGSTLRCVVVDSKGGVVLEESKKIVLLTNICLREGSEGFHPHPNNCRRYAQCANNLMYDLPCGPNTCAIGYPPPGSDEICNEICYGCT